MAPEVLYLILCDDVKPDPQNYVRFIIHGLMTRIRSTATPPFPMTQPWMCALRVLTGCQGSGYLSLQIIRGDDGAAIFRNSPRPVRFVGNPSETLGIAFRVRNCVFPTSGLYWVEIVYDGAILARQRLSIDS